MTTFGRLVLAAAVVAAGGAATARAEWVPGKRLVESATRLMGQIEKVTDGTTVGYDGDNCLLTTFLLAKREAGFKRWFQADTDYYILGGGDNAVNDLDVKVLDAAGNPMVADTGANASPVVKFRTRRAGMYEIRLVMFDADSNGGFATAAVLKDGGFRVPVRNLAAALAALIAGCENVDRQAPGAVVFNNAPNQWAVYGSIVRPGADMVIEKLTPGGGGRVWLVGADENARDLDLYLTDDDKRELKSDTDPDARPQVVYRTQANTQYGFKVKNVKSDGLTLVLVAVLDI